MSIRLGWDTELEREANKQKNVTTQAWIGALFGIFFSTVKNLLGKSRFIISRKGYNVLYVYRLHQITKRV